MDLENFFSKDRIIYLNNTEKQLVLREMLEKLEEFGLIENSNKYYTQIIHRESLENTGIGEGFAIPHSRTDTVADFIPIFGISKDGIDYQSIDGKSVNYVLLSIFPTDMSTKYLYFVGMMSRIFSNSEIRPRLDAADSSDAMYSILQREFELYFDDIVSKDEAKLAEKESLNGASISDLDLIIRLDRMYKLSDQDRDSESIQQKIKELKKLIDNRSLTYYERMREKCKNPFSVIERNSCSGCHLEIPSIDIKNVKEKKGVSVCTHCGRFLIII